MVWDDTGSPVSNLQLTIETADGQRDIKQTDSEGRIRLDQVPEGMCEVRCGTSGSTMNECVEFASEGEKQAAESGDSSGSSSSTQSGAAPESTRTRSGNPLMIAKVEKYKVKTGDTLAGIASKNGMPLKDLTMFNWGTDDPDDINQHLAQDVGCTKKTEDGKYTLDDGDTPGIIYVPKQWKYSAGTSTKHTIRVNWAEKQVVNMRWFRIKLVQKDKDTYKVLDNKGFEFKPDDERYGCSAVTNGQGVFEIKIPDTIQTATLNFDDISIDVILEKDFPAAKTVKGAQARLNNLGYEPGPVSGNLDDKTKVAIKAFQQKHAPPDQSVPSSGELDQKTQDDLKSDYGC